MDGRRGQCGEGQATASKTEPFFVAERAAHARVPLNFYRRFEPLQTLRRGQPCSVGATVRCLPCGRARARCAAGHGDAGQHGPSVFG
jgi:hypothetical protein